MDELGIEKDVLTDMEEQFWAWDVAYGGEDGDVDEVWGEDERDG